MQRNNTVRGRTWFNSLSTYLIARSRYAVPACSRNNFFAFRCVYLGGESRLSQHIVRGGRWLDAGRLYHTAYARLKYLSEENLYDDGFRCVQRMRATHEERL